MKFEEKSRDALVHSSEMACSGPAPTLNTRSAFELATAMSGRPSPSLSVIVGGPPRPEDLHALDPLADAAPFVVPPPTEPERLRSIRETEGESARIRTLYDADVRAVDREIGRLLGRHHTTIGRELRCNSLPKAGYKLARADHMAFCRCKRLSKLERLRPLQLHVRDCLACAWSPASRFLPASRNSFDQL